VSKIELIAEGTFIKQVTFSEAAFWAQYTSEALDDRRIYFK